MAIQRLSWEPVVSPNVGLSIENIPLPKLLEVMARESYCLNGSNRTNLPNFSPYIFLGEEQPTSDRTKRTVLHMDYVEGKRCKTRVDFVKDEIYVPVTFQVTRDMTDFSLTYSPQFSVRVQSKTERLVFDANWFQQRGDPEEYLQRVKTVLHGKE